MDAPADPDSPASLPAPRGRGEDAPRLTPGLALLLAVAAGSTVANLYYAQPLLPTLAAAFSVEPGRAGWITTVTQAGYASGMILIVPLGDTLERRKLIVGTTLAVGAALLGVARAPTFGWLLATSYLLGLATVVPQIVIPFAATLASAGSRGRSIGMVMGGTLTGVLLSRTASGFAGARLGWRAVYEGAAGLMLVLAVALAFALPRQSPPQRIPYLELLRSLPGISLDKPLLRRHAVLGALTFACFSVFWTTLAFFLAGPPYGYGSDVAGLFGVVGVVGALGAPFLGRLADVRGSRFVNLLAILVVLVSFAVFALWGRSLVGLVLGVLLLDLGVQANHISNQALVLGLAPDLTNRINTIYMVTYFAGGAAGSVLGAYSWSAGGWSAVTALGLGFAAAALLAFLTVAPKAR
jgi:predicted MFS family arabinose efflux permease